VLFVNLLKPEGLEKLNSLFNTNYRPSNIEAEARIIGQDKGEINKEIDRLMRQKPKGGGYGI
jgi:hypothetical protein